MSKLLNVSSSPHVRCGVSTKNLMYDVAIAMLPATIWGVMQFGIRSLIVVVATVLSCVLSEYIFETLMHKPVTISDGSALVTGMILGLNMPPAIPIWMPILGGVRAKDFDDAVEQAVWLEHGNRHSAHIHSKNIDNITKYAKAIDTAILVKNGPSYSALGFGGEGFCTFTIASRTGEGLTSASTFTKRRRCVMADSLCIR